jgi:(2Fe-2S) ferredoxin
MSKHDKLPSVEKIGRRSTVCLAMCADKHCARAGAKQLRQTIEASLHEHGLSEQVTVEWTKCQDFCDDSPALTVLPQGLSYIRMTLRSARQIVESHIIEGEPVIDLLDKKSRHRLLRRRKTDD